MKRGKGREKKKKSGNREFLQGGGGQKYGYPLSILSYTHYPVDWTETGFYGSDSEAHLSRSWNALDIFWLSLADFWFIFFSIPDIPDRIS